jgi:cell wall-associated NlpC family hydrolase
MPFDETICTAILAHARICAALSPPEEAAGIIRRGAYIPLDNIAKNPAIGFEISTADLEWPEIEAIVHSHPGGPAYPSNHDMCQQIASNIPWVIAVTPTASTPALREELFCFGQMPALDLAKGYRHGVIDCYSLIRGFYQTIFAVTLPDVPRAWDWWHEGHDLYAEGLNGAGFTLLAADAPLRVGDVFLAQVRGATINHAGIWLGDGLILHHLGGLHGHQPERLPRKEPAERWLKFINGWARHACVK